MQLKKSSRRIREKPSGSSEEGEGIAAAGLAMDATEYTSEDKVEKIGDSNPVQDFEAMLSRRDSPHWVSEALKRMQDKIFDLVKNSIETESYQKILDCLVALRKGCLIEQVCNTLTAYFSFKLYRNGFNASLSWNDDKSP